MTLNVQTDSALRRLFRVWRTHTLSFAVVGAIVFMVGLHLSLNAVSDVYETKAVLVYTPADASERANVATPVHSDVVTDDAVARAAEALERITPDTLPSTRKMIIDKLRGQLTVRTPDVGEIEIAARGSDTGTIVVLVNHVAAGYIARCEQDRRTFVENAGTRRRELTALADALKEAEAALSRAREDVNTFETTHADVIRRSGPDLETATRELRKQHERMEAYARAVKVEITGIEQNRAFLVERLRTVPEFIETRETTTEPDSDRRRLEREIRAMEVDLKQKLTEYTRKHPEIIKREFDLLAKRRELRTLKRRVETTIKSRKEANPEYVDTKRRLNDAVTELQRKRNALKGASAEADRLARRIDALEGLIKPHRQRREALAAKTRLAAEAKNALDAKTREAAAERETAAPVPHVNRLASIETCRKVGPRRTLYLVGALAVALLAGVAASSTAFRLSPGFASAEEITRVTGVATVGAVSAVTGTEADRRRRLWKHVRLLALLGILAVVVASAATMLHAAG